MSTVFYFTLDDDIMLSLLSRFFFSFSVLSVISLKAFFACHIFNVTLYNKLQLKVGGKLSITNISIKYHEPVIAELVQ